MTAAITAAVIVAGAGAYSANQTARAGRDAARVQADAANEATAEQRRQFEYVQQLMSPYVQQGHAALTQQAALAGANGQAAQREAIDAIESSPMFQAQIAQGENALRQNASATGGLRGGNTQAALAGLRPSMLGAAINDRMTALGQLSVQGQNAAAGVGSNATAFGQAAANNMQGGAAATAGGILATQRANNQMVNSVAQGVGGAVTAYARPAPAAPAASAAPVWRADGGMGGTV